MKKLLIAMCLVCSGVASAAPFVYPKSWVVAQPALDATGGVFRDQLTGEYQTFNPFTEVISGVTSTLSATINARGLFISDPISGEMLPYMAESYEYSTSKLNLTVKIRQGMKWSDGLPITANDWIVTAKIHTAPDIVTTQRDRFFIDGKVVVLKKIDDYTLVFAFPKVIADSLNTVSFAPWPAHVFQDVYEKQGGAGIKTMWDLKSDATKVVSAGAFQLESYRLNDAANFKRNPYFAEWNVNENGTGLPYLDRLVLKYYLNRSVGSIGFLNNEIDSVTTPTPTDVIKFKNAVEQQNFPAVIKPNATSVGVTIYAMFNWNRASDPFKQDLFRNVLFRQAMSHMMNRDLIVSKGFLGLAKPSYSSFTEAFGDWVSPDAKKFSYNLQAAETLLARIGFRNKNNEGYLVDKTGRVLEFDLLITTERKALLSSSIDIMQQDAKTLGVKINLIVNSTGAVNKVVTSTGKDRAWDMTMGIGFLNNIGNYPLTPSFYSCKGFLHNYNGSGECLDPLETQAMVLYERGRQTVNLDDRIAIVHKVQEVMAQLQPTIHIVALYLSHSWNPKVQGELSSTRQGQLRWYETTWIKN